MVAGSEVVGAALLVGCSDDGPPDGVSTVSDGVAVSVAPGSSDTPGWFVDVA